MKTLLFINPELRKGLNVTVRRGDKWMKEVTVGDVVNIEETITRGPYGQATIVGKAYIPFVLIPQGWLYHEHDHTCTNLQGLFDAMIRAYPDFGAGEMTTVLLFKMVYRNERIHRSHTNSDREVYRTASNTDSNRIMNTQFRVVM